MSEGPPPPRVFVSYSDDSTAHAKRVLQLAQWLRSHGVDAHIDQFEESPEEGWPRWIYRQIHEAEFVLVIATPGYLRRCEGAEPRADTGDSAVKFSSHLSLQELHEAGGHNRKFVPVLFDDDAIVESVPLSLRGATCYRLPDQRDDLYRRLTGQPKVQRAPLGVLKTFDDESLYDTVDEFPEPGARARARLDEQRADDSLRAMVDAGVIDERERDGPRPRWRRSWWQTNRQWLIGIATFGAVFTTVGLLMGTRIGKPDDPKCRLQLTDSTGEVVDGIDRVILELPSGDEIEVVVENGRTLEFACLSSTVQAQAHVYLSHERDPRPSPTAPPVRIDGRIELPSLERARDEVMQTRLVEVTRARPIPRVEPPPRADPPEGSDPEAPKPGLEVGTKPEP